jgi:hypothetical protein
MASSSPPPISLRWYWIIETLADSKQAEPHLLTDLIKRFPNFYTTAPESVRERVSLRYLEECATRGIVETKNSSGGVVDISRSTEEFLCKNLTRPIDPSEPSQGVNAKVPSAREDGSSSSHRRGDIILDGGQVGVIPGKADQQL